MPFKQIGLSVDAYTKILSRAWKTTWQHKELWIVGVLAGIANAGSILNQVSRLFWQIQPIDSWKEQIIASTKAGIPWLLPFFQRMLQYHPSRIFFTAALILIALIVLGIIVFSAQHILLQGIHRSKTHTNHFTLRELWKSLRHHHLLRVFAINAYAWLSTTLLLLLSTFPLTFFLSSSTLANGFVYAAFYIVLVPIVFVINALGMFTLIHVVRFEETIWQALGKSWHVLKTHWVTAFETGLVLYLINLLMPLCLFIVSLLIAAPLSLFAVSTLATGTTVLMYIIYSIVILFLIALFIAFTGALATFNYAVWTHMLEYIEKRRIIPFVERVARAILRT